MAATPDPGHQPPASAERQGEERPAPLVLEDRPTLLIPKQPRTEAEEDRLQALALFAAGRMRQRRMDYAGALRLYQRALRCDPESLTVARAIVPLAFRLDRKDEAVRYALKVVEMEEADPLLLRSLAKHLVEAGDLERAVALYEKAVVPSGQERTAADVAMQLELGQFYQIVGKHQEAADQFARVLYALEHPEKFELDEKARAVLLGEKGTAYNLFGEAFLMAGRFDEALTAFDSANRAAPNAALWSYHRARVDARAGRHAKALEMLRAGFRADLTNQGTEPYRLLAELLKALDKENELVGRLEKFLADDPSNVALSYFLADSLRDAERFDEAEPLYRQALAKTPTLTGYRSLIDIYLATNRPEKLLDLLAELAGATASLEGLGEEGERLFDDEAFVARVIRAARKRLARAPDEFPYRDCLAVALLAARTKQTKVAGEFFDLAVQAKPKRAAELLLLWGVDLLVQNKPGEAADVFQRGIDENPAPKDNPAFYFYLASALEMDGRTDEALAAAEKAALAKPDSARFQNRRAWVLYHARRHAEAERAYHELIERFDSDYESAETRLVLRDARLALSNICVMDRRMARGEQWLNEVLDEFPDDIGALNDLGYLWADAGKHLQRALLMIQTAVEGDPDNVAYRDSLGWVLFRLDRHKEAVVELENAAAENPDAVILDHLGDVHHALEQPEKARDAWRRAIEAFRKEGRKEDVVRTEEKIRAAEG